jgi:hypothetical protein
MVLLPLATDIQGSSSPDVRELEAHVMLETKESEPWARIRNASRRAKLVCVSSVFYTTTRGGGGAGPMSHACTHETAFSVVLANESHVLRLPGTFILDREAPFSVGITVVTRPFRTSVKSTDSASAVVTWRGTVEEAVEAFRRVTGVEP